MYGNTISEPFLFTSYTMYAYIEVKITIITIIISEIKYSSELKNLGQARLTINWTTNNQIAVLLLFILFLRLKVVYIRINDSKFSIS